MHGLADVFLSALNAGPQGCGVALGKFVASVLKTGVQSPEKGKGKGKGKERRCGRCGHYHSGVCRTPESQLRAPSSTPRLTKYQMNDLQQVAVSVLGTRPKDHGVGLAEFLAPLIDKGAGPKPQEGKGKGKRPAEDASGSQDGPDRKKKKKKKGGGGSGRTSCAPPNPGRGDRKDPPPGRGAPPVTNAYARR